MSFEDFKSLKGKIISLRDEENNGYDDAIIELWFSDLDFCCLDKQKVREAIEESEKDYQEYDGEYSDMLYVPDLKKRLGL